MPANSSLLQWLATFKFADQPAIELKTDAYYNLADGFVCARILNQISPLYFTDKWLDGIKPVAPNGSWRLRVSNLKRILQKMHDYASDLQSSQFMLSAINPDVTVIAQNFDPDQISRLIQLILFCAINCDNKQDYIKIISDLPTQVKQDIKEAIEELLVKNNKDNHPQHIKSNTSQAGSELNPNESDDVTRGSRFNLSSSSSNILNSPGRNLGYQRQTRRDSSQSDVNRRNESSQLDISSASYHSDSTDNPETIRRKLSEALRVVDQKAQSYYELEMKLKQLQLERNQLQYENERLISEKSLNSSPKVTPGTRRRSSAFKDTGVENLELTSQTQSNTAIENDPNSRELMYAQNRRLQAELQRLERELNRVETEREDFRLKSNLLSEDLDRITTKHEDLKSKAEQAKRLQDELDEHKQITEKVITYETMVENLAKKNGDMKKELKKLEEKNLAHIQKIVQLEQENQQLETTVSQVDLYKKQLSEAHLKLGKEAHRADKAEVDLARLSDKLTAAKRENEQLFKATNQLMQNNHLIGKKNEIPTLSRAFESVNLKRDGDTRSKSSREIELDQSGDNILDSISATPVIELKERIARLEIENQLLQAKVNSNVEMRKSVLGSLLDEATEKCRRLEEENRQARKKMLVLESNLKEFTQNQQADEPIQPSTSRTQPPMLPMVPMQDSSSDNVFALIKRVEELQRALYQREQELRDADVRYKRNLSKAKDAMKSLVNNQQSLNNSGSGGSIIHPSCMSSASFNSSSLDEASLLRQQLREREERIIELEREFYEFKKLKEVHERLILSAFHGLTTPMQWKNVERRLERTSLTSPSNIANVQLGKNQ